MIWDYLGLSKDITITNEPTIDYNRLSDNTTTSIQTQKRSNNSSSPKKKSSRIRENYNRINSYLRKYNLQDDNTNQSMINERTSDTIPEHHYQNPKSNSEKASKYENNESNANNGTKDIPIIDKINKLNRKIILQNEYLLELKKCIELNE
ncbi:hypothetical protein KGF54_001125 [Candida jiufengensis]|uniref:uncharacterized protein n=1 Tax=Candida jiufengensis TaxID=497108 RepID=UPI002224C3D0|nr:uncharacterized protein KGF54_001125 [Candida jiufengensis]KAI5955623.1 hypothetical protein KGF54_001125 [Candida jiufengensis]